MSPSRLTERMLADAAGVSTGTLRLYSEEADRFFLASRVEIKRGKSRLIDEPKPDYMRVQRRLLTAFDQWRFHHSAAYGGVRGRSHIDSARTHCQVHTVVIRDLSKAYPSVGPVMLAEELAIRGFTPEVVGLLTGLLTVRNRIPQGAPLSNLALNLYLYRADHLIASFAGAHGLNYSRLADDLVVSVPIGVTRVHHEGIGKLVDEAIQMLKLTVNEKKRRKNGLQRRGENKLIHNVEVATTAGVGMCNAHAQQCIALSTSYVRAARCVHPENLRTFEKKRRSLNGWINCALAYDRAPATFIAAQMKTGDRILGDRLRRLGVAVHPQGWWRGLEDHSSIDALVLAWKGALAHKCT